MKRSERIRAAIDEATRRGVNDMAPGGIVSAGTAAIVRSVQNHLLVELKKLTVVSGYTKSEGVDYSPAGIEDLRQELMPLRDEALKQQQFGYAVILSHTICLLDLLVHIMKEVNDE